MTIKKAPPAALAGSPDEVEARFYEALQKADLEGLMAVWADDDEIVCIHPAGPRIVGPTAIRAAFAAIFARGALSVRPEHVRRVQHLGSSLHHLVERIEVPGGSAGSSQTAWVLATNFYVKTPLGWRLASHHASPGSLEETPAQGIDAPATLH